MLDINKIKENKEAVEKALLKRVAKKDLNLDRLITIDDERRELIQEIDSMKAIRNKGSKEKPSAEKIEELKRLGEKINSNEKKLLEKETEFNELISEIPNIPADDVVAGGKENNEVIKSFGEKPKFKFKNKDHVGLATDLGLIDYERATKMSGRGFWAYTDIGAQLEWALLNYFVDFHRENNYKFMLLPHLLNEQSAYNSGHLPKFKDDLFWTQDGTCLNATAEMMLGNYHSDEILDKKDLPIKYFCYAPSFRREAGAYRTEERGMIRGHQFNKIEMFQFTKPEKSWEAFDELIENAQRLVEGLGLHFQTVKLAAGDCSAAMAKTYDIEIWMPSMEIYKEVSSISNALDYQSRRAKIRYKDDEGKSNYVHTLNASGLATSRLFPAILEQFQQEDGSVLVPERLQKYLNGLEVINPK